MDDHTQAREEQRERDAQRVAYCNVIAFTIIGCIAVTVVMWATGQWPLTWDFLWRWCGALLLVLLIQTCALWVSFRTWLKPFDPTVVVKRR
jgi:hypothetical protein